MVAKSYVEPRNRVTVCQLVISSQKRATVPACTAIATITPATILSERGTSQRQMPHDFTGTSASVNSVHVDETTHEERLDLLQKDGFHLSAGDLTPDQFAELVALLYEYRHAFAADVRDLPGVKDVEYNITLQPGARPKRQRQYRYPPHMREVIRQQLTDWERAGIISEGDPTWIHPVVLVRKKSPDGNPNTPPQYRACLDLRAINKAWWSKAILCLLSTL